MLPDVSVNYVAILAAAISSMIVGATWYAPPLFGRQWMKLVGLSEEQAKQNNQPQAYAMMFGLSLILAYVLAHFVNYAEAVSVGDALQLGFWIWLGFVVTTMGAHYVFVRKPFNLFGIDAGYHLVQLVVMAVILTVWV